jgi:hypothetical protein
LLKKEISFLILDTSPKDHKKGGMQGELKIYQIKATLEDNDVSPCFQLDVVSSTGKQLITYPSNVAMSAKNPQWTREVCIRYNKYSPVLDCTATSQ